MKTPLIPVGVSVLLAVTHVLGPAHGQPNKAYRSVGKEWSSPTNALALLRQSLSSPKFGRSHAVKLTNETQVVKGALPQWLENVPPGEAFTSINNAAPAVAASPAALEFTVTYAGQESRTWYFGDGTRHRITLNGSGTVKVKPHQVTTSDGESFISNTADIVTENRVWGTAIEDGSVPPYTFDFDVTLGVSRLPSFTYSHFTPLTASYLYFESRDEVSASPDDITVYAWEYVSNLGVMRMWVALEYPFYYDSQYEHYDFPATHVVTGQSVARSCLLGTLVNPQGQAVAGAQVRFGGVSRTTDAQGKFQYDDIPPADYLLTINKQGHPELENVENLPPFSIIRRTYTLPCCDARNAARPVEVSFPSMWWPLSQFQNRLSTIQAESGERLEVWWVVPGASGEGAHYELRHYAAGAGQGLNNGIKVGGCYFVQGVNDADYVAVDSNGNGQPDCFLKVNWYNFDFGEEDEPADGFLDVRVFEYFVCQDLVVVTRRKHEFGCGGPPASNPLTFQTPRCMDWLGTRRSITTELVYPGHSATAPRVAFAHAVPPTPSEDPFADFLLALISQGVNPTNMAMGIIPIPVGDVDLSLSVDEGDYTTLVAAMGCCLGESNYVSLADVNGDSCISLLDLQNLFSGDSDEDRMLDWHEWIAGTNPFDRDSVLRIASAQTSASGSLVLRWPSIEGRTYVLSRSSMLPWATPAEIITNVVATPPVNIFEDPTATNARSYFYRLELW